MIRILNKQTIKNRLREAFDSYTVRFEQDHRDGLRILAKQALQHRILIAVVFAANLLAALFEGGTIGILAIAVSVLVENDTAAVEARFGAIGPYITSLVSEVGRGGLFLILVLTAVMAQILKSGLTYAANYFSIRLRFLVNKDLQQLVVRQAMRLTYAEISRFPAGAVDATIRQAESFSRLILIFNKLSLTLLMFTVYIAVMIIMSVPLTLAAIIVIVFLGLALNGVIRLLRTLGERMAAATVATGKLTYEYLQASRLLRIFNATGFAEKSIARVRNEMLHSREKAEVVKSAISPATDAVTITGAGLFLIVGYTMAGESASAIIPSLLLFVFVLNRMMPHVKSFNEARMNIVHTLPTLKRVAGFLREEDKSFTRRGGQPFSGLVDEIRFEDVSFKYPDSAEYALSHISFSIPKGWTVALVGASGAGKSTIADLLLGLYEPDSGHITVDGTDLKRVSLMDWRSHIGVVDQDVLLFNATVLNNIAFGHRDYSRQMAIEAAKAADAHDFIMALPKGYDTEIGDRGYRLSGGQQQRLALARALIRNPGILVLDEATSALDTESERIIQNTLENLQHHRTMLVIAHRLSTLVRADNIVVLQRGQVVEAGTWQELTEKDGTFRRLWDLQSIQHA
ncbi:MAG: ABC transporter ATP-binding protein [Gammaproteobacteria bacterium]|nr:ABC transporter ATP-binding protein [Gammaproteobacteria bacterium]